MSNYHRIPYRLALLAFCLVFIFSVSIAEIVFAEDNFDEVNIEETDDGVTGDDISSSTISNPFRSPYYLFYPNQTHTVEGGFKTPYELYGCTLGEKILINGELVRCTTNPFWYGVQLNDYMLQPDGLNAQLEALTINSLRLFTEYMQDSSGSNAVVRVPGLLPMDEHVVYQQRLPGDASNFTLEELSHLLSVFPSELFPEDLALLTSDGANWQPMAPGEAPRPFPIAKAVLDTLTLNDLQGRAGTVALGTLLNQHYLSGIDRVGEQMNDAGTGGQYQSFPLAKLNDPWYLQDSPFTVKAPTYSDSANTVSRIINTQEGTSEVIFPTGGTPEENKTIALSGDVELEGSMATFNLKTQREIRLKPQFYCKAGPAHIETYHENPALPVDGLAFQQGYGNTACAAIGNAAVADSGWQINQPYPYSTSSEIAQKGLSYLSGYHLDWFEASQQCMSRGGRLPKSQELIAMGAYTFEKGNQSPFFRDGAPAGFNGVIIPADDLVAAMGTPYYDHPAVFALYVPAKGQDFPSFNHDVDCLDIAGNFSETYARNHQYLDFSKAKFCPFELHYRPNRNGNGDRGSDNNTIYYADLFDPAAGITESFPGVYPASVDQVPNLPGGFTTAATCVYD